jgi:hypothetical protein
MKRSFLFILAILSTSGLLWAQEGQGVTQGDILKELLEEGPRDRVHIEVDSQLVANYHKLISQNMRSSGVPGYRIRIYSESGLGAKQEQQQVRARFLSLFPGIDAYNRYDEPYFKIYVGDCRTRSDALKLHDRISREFPDSFIQEDYINLKSAE